MYALLLFLLVLVRVFSSSAPEPYAFIGEFRSREGIPLVRQWFREHHFLLHENVQIEWSKGIHVRLNGSLPVESEVVRSPSSFLIPPWLPKRKHKQTLLSFDDKERLVVRLLYELQKGETSKWFGYFKMLPKAGELATFPIFWDVDVHMTYPELRGTFFSSALQIKIDKVHKFYNKLVRSRILNERPGFDIVKWAVAMIDSRSFRISKKKGTHRLNDRPFLAPLADLLNHNRHAKVGWKLGYVGSSTKQKKKTFFRIFSIGGLDFLRGGEDVEVYNTYNTATSSTDFLLHYGFVPKPSSETDYLPLELSLPREDGLYSDREMLRQLLNVSTSARFYYGKPFPTQLLKLVCIINLRAEDLRDVLQAKHTLTKFQHHEDETRPHNMELLKKTLRGLKRSGSTKTHEGVGSSIREIVGLENSIIDHHIEEIDKLQQQVELREL